MEKLTAQNRTMVKHTVEAQNSMIEMTKFVVAGLFTGVSLFAVVSIFSTAAPRENVRLTIVTVLRIIGYTIGYACVAVIYIPVLILDWLSTQWAKRYVKEPAPVPRIRRKRTDSDVSDLYLDEFGDDLEEDNNVGGQLADAIP